MEGDAKRFPLVRTFWSNEKVMALLFALLVAWHVPSWLMGSAVLVPRFAGLVALSLLVDAVCNLIRYRRFLCSVSAAVTAGVVWVLAPACAPSAPYSLTLAAVVASLFFGKHLFGGTGRNVCNPAMLALAVMVLVSPHGLPVQVSFAATAEVSLATAARAWPLIVACACLPFLAFRPFAGGLFTLGATISFCMVVFGAGGSALFHDPALASAAALSLVTAFVVMTDPVTVTAHPIAGSAVGALAGAVSGASFLGLGGLSSGALPFVILTVNALSYAVDRLLPPVRAKGLVRVRGIARRSGMILADKRGEVLRGDTFETEKLVGKLSANEMLSRIRDAGIVGLGGAGFPTHVKIETFRSSSAPRKMLIVNAVECDPGLFHDKWLLATKGAEIAESLSLLMIACGCDEAALAVKRGTSVPSNLVSILPAGVRLVRVPNRYPVGAERILIHRVAGVTIPSGAIPAREGFLVINVQTALAAREAVLAPSNPARDGLPARERYLTVADLRARESIVVSAREGEPLDAVFARAFPASAGAQLFAGGGLMQAYRAFADDVVRPGVNFITRGNAPRFRESPQCSRCLRCADSCPVGLDVREIVEFVDAGKYDRAIELGADRCLSCGSCSVSCLAGKNLSHRLSIAKRLSRERGTDLSETLE
jgi:Na+-translocating ferredoxin:NAD+ oxidoreductase RnfD subunit/ferredoxin